MQNLPFLLAKSPVTKWDFSNIWISTLCGSIITLGATLDCAVLFYFIHWIEFIFCLFICRFISSFSPGFLPTSLNQNVVYFRLLNNQLEERLFLSEPQTFSRKPRNRVWGRTNLGRQPASAARQLCDLRQSTWALRASVVSSVKWAESQDLPYESF